MAEQVGGRVDSVMQESRLFPPPAEFAAKARIGSMAAYEKMWTEAAADIEGFWAQLAGELHWFEPYSKGAGVERAVRQMVCRRPDQRFVQLPRRPSRHAARKTRPPFSGRASRATSGRSPISSCTAKSAGSPTCSRNLGISQGDVVSIYMPMVPELAIAMLACARIGAIHSRDFRRLFQRSDRRSEQRRPGKAGHHGRRRLAARADIAAQGERRCGAGEIADREKLRRALPQRQQGHMQDGRDHWWHDMMNGASPRTPAEPLDSETPLYILYTSGSTGKPKGIKHTTGRLQSVLQEDVRMGVRPSR